MSKELKQNIQKKEFKTPVQIDKKKIQQETTEKTHIKIPNHFALKETNKKPTF